MEAALTENQELQQSEVRKEVMVFYGDDFNHKDRLEGQLVQLHAGSEQALVDVQTIAEYLQCSSTAERDYFTEVVKLVKLILVMPATNSASGRSFSALHRLNTCLRTTKCQARLNWCILLHIHKERTDALLMLTVANELVS